MLFSIQCFALLPLLRKQIQVGAFLKAQICYISQQADLLSPRFSELLRRIGTLA